MESLEGYYAFVTHPFDTMNSTTVAKGLGLLASLWVLPGDSFDSDKGRGDANADSNPMEREFGTRRFRISIANVKGEDAVDESPRRKALLSQLRTEKGQDWGIV